MVGLLFFYPVTHIFFQDSWVRVLKKTQFFQASAGYSPGAVRLSHLVFRCLPLCFVDAGRGCLGDRLRLARNETQK